MSAQAEAAREALRRLETAIVRQEDRVQQAAVQDPGHLLVQALQQDLQRMREEAARLRRLLLAP